MSRLWIIGVLSVLVFLALLPPALAEDGTPATPERQDGEWIPFGSGGAFVKRQNYWRYQAGDDPAWVDPAFDDTSWELVGNPWIQLALRTKTGWRLMSGHFS
jgi:hypothetical protein